MARCEVAVALAAPVPSFLTIRPRAARPIRAQVRFYKPNFEASRSLLPDKRHLIIVSIGSPQASATRPEEQSRHRQCLKYAAYASGFASKRNASRIIFLKAQRPRSPLAMKVNFWVAIFRDGACPPVMVDHGRDTIYCLRSCRVTAADCPVL